MDAIFKKLNYKEQKEIIVLNAPKSFEENLKAMKSVTSIVKKLEKAENIEFLISFVTTQAEIEIISTQFAEKLEGDAIVWFCYPKQSSKNYQCDFNRDTGWTVLGQYNLEPVRQVAIDEDWSALRFRKVEYIKKITRKESFAMTEEAKKRTTQKGK